MHIYPDWRPILQCSAKEVLRVDLSSLTKMPFSVTPDQFEVSFSTLLKDIEKRSDSLGAPIDVARHISLVSRNAASHHNTTSDMLRVFFRKCPRR